MYVVIRFSRARDGSVVHRTPDSGDYTSPALRGKRKALLARAERPGARRAGELIRAEIPDVAAQAHRVARAGPQLLARLDLELAAAAQLDRRLDLVAAGREQEHRARADVHHPLGEVD